MPTVAEVLKSAGLTDEQIAGIDAKAVEGFTTVLSTAAQERAQAELAQRAATQMFENEITPALNAWGTKETNLTAERDYYKTLAEKAVDGGFAAAAPPFKEQQRGPGGQFVANANAVPGSPNMQEFESKIGNALGNLSDLQWKYQTLFGGVMPDSPTALAAEASAQRMPLVEYAAKKYDFAGKQASIQAEQQKKHDDAIRAEVGAAKDKEWTEKFGTNPNIRVAQTSQFTELRRGVAEGNRPDPIKMTRDERHAATADAIRRDQAAQVQ